MNTLAWLVLAGLISLSGTAASKDSKSKGEVENLVCPDCKRLYCSIKKLKKLQCKGGITTDICECCPVCAKLKGEACGGSWDYLGKCDKGLECKPLNHSMLLYQMINPTPPPKNIPEGTCVEKLPNDEQDKDKKGRISIARTPEPPSPLACQPKCTPEFCLLNPRAICSAVEAHDVKRDCQGQCQHTSCSACSWVEPEPDCGGCALDDFACIKTFAKCIKKNYCTKQKYPCKSNIPETVQLGKFQCVVPRCLVP